MNQTQTARRDIDILRDEFTAMSGQFAMALPKHVPVDRFVRVGMTCFQNYPDLIKCTKHSLWNAFMKCAGDGLLPDGRESVILPFKTKVKDRYELIATYIPMIAGIRKKVRNSGVMADWFAEVVHQKDEFDFQRGTENFLRHKQSLEADRGPIIAAYSVAFLKDGQGYSFDLMSKSEVDRIRNLSKSPEGPGWKNHYSEMAKKTVARRHSKVLPMSTDLDDLIRADDDIHGAADIPAVSGASRPQLEDFSHEEGSDETGASDDGKAGKQAKEAKADEATENAKPAEMSTDAAHDPETGEVRDEATATSTADKQAAFILGRSDFASGRSFTATPLHFREAGAEALLDKWREGWKAAADEKKRGK
jgi:recombination protein RecT